MKLFFPHLNTILQTRTNSIAIDEGTSLRLDILRVGLLAEVILGHLGWMALGPAGRLVADPVLWFGIPFRLLTRFGRESAFLFIYMSGFFIGGQLLRDKLNGQQPDPRDFVSRRVLRLLPTLTIALLITAILDGAAVRLLDLGRTYSSYGAYDMVAYATIRNFIGNVLCLQPTFVDVFGSNGPLWTLGYIVQFYLVGFIIIRYGIYSRPKRPILVLVFIAMAVVSLQWLLLFTIWMIGAFARNFIAQRSATKLFFWAFLLAVAISNLLPTFGSAALTGLSGPLATGWTLSCNWKPDARVAALVRHGARLSYAAYAVHFSPAFFLVAVVFKERVRTAGGFALFLAMSLAAVYLLSFAVWRSTNRVAVKGSGFRSLQTPSHSAKSIGMSA